MEFDEIIKKRHSIRNFSEKKPDYRKIIFAIESATYAPQAGNLPTLRFILVSNKDKIKELAQAATQSFIEKAPYIIVVCSDNKLLKKYYYERSDKYSKQQAGAAIENFLLKITDLKLASCWVGAFSDETVKRILKIPDELEVEAILPVGFEKEKNPDVIPKKPDLLQIIYFEKYKNRYMKPRYSGEVQ